METVRVYVVYARHTMSPQLSTLEVRDGETWRIGRGRSGGSRKDGKWVITFDKALSREHFRMTMNHGRLLVEATNNRHPIIFRKQRCDVFEVASGEQFATSHLRFVFKECDELDATGKLDTLPPLLSLTGMLAILIRKGVGYSRIFALLRAHHERLRPVLDDLERQILQGTPLSIALVKYPEVFPQTYIGMVELGESSNLGRALERLYRQLARQPLTQGELTSEHPEALAHACRSLADVLDGGGNLSKGLELVAKTCSEEKIQAAILALEAQVREGKRFSDCTFPPVFPPIASALAAAYEEVGMLSDAFEELAELFEPQ
jgi:type II secretory pathway component PulF